MTGLPLAQDEVVGRVLGEGVRDELIKFGFGGGFEHLQLARDWVLNLLDVGAGHRDRAPQLEAGQAPAMIVLNALVALSIAVVMTAASPRDQVAM